MKYFFITIFFFCSIQLSAQNTILWKVTNAKSQNVSYLLGTNHIIGNSFVDSFPIIKEKLISSDILITETELNREKMAEYYNSAPSTTNLSEILSVTDVNFIKDLMKKSKIDVFKLSPGILYISLNSNYPKFKCGNPKDSTVFDMYLQQIAKTENKKLLYLENDSLGLSLLKQMTRKFTWDNFEQLIPSLLEKYKNVNADDKDCASINEYSSFYFDYKFGEKCKTDAGKVEERNNNWMKIIPSLLEHDNCLIAVGLFHLYYKCGIIEQLKQLGYTVEPVKMN